MDVERLKTSGARSMVVALNCWYSNYDDMAVMNAGIGCEHLLKAYLVNYHPLLISDARDLSLRFHAIGREDAALTPLSQARTISADQSFKQAAALMNNRMPISARDFELILAARNGVAHSAFHDESRTAETLDFAIKVADAIRIELQVEEGEFWGSYVS
ncbi:hypothetical protein [Nonomuraea sp. NPDC002799]